MTLNKEWKNLLELAEKATPGKIEIFESDGEFLLLPMEFPEKELGIATIDFKEDAEYIAAASPDVIKRLIEELVELHDAAGDYLSGHACIHEERLRKVLEKGKS